MKHTGPKTTTVVDSNISDNVILVCGGGHVLEERSRPSEMEACTQIRGSSNIIEETFMLMILQIRCCSTIEPDGDINVAMLCGPPNT